MSYFDLFGGHTSADDPAPTGGGRDEPFRARHQGVAPDSYVDDRLSPDPYAAYRRDAGSAVSPYRDYTADVAYDADATSGGEMPHRTDVSYGVDGLHGEGWQDGGSEFDDAPGRGGGVLAVGDGGAAYPKISGGPKGESSGDAGPEAVRRGPGRRRAGRSRTAAGAAPARSGRAGRNLQAAILVGSSLGAVVVASLFIWPPAFVGVIAAAVSIGIWEMARALRGGGANPPLVPLLAGGVLMVGLAKYAGTEGLTLGVLVTVAASMVWRLADGTADLLRDLTATTLISVYVPFLLGFAVLLIEQDDGSYRVLATLLAVVLSDTGGYAAGVFLGRHPMAPKISPKKSWEGFGGSVLAAGLGSALTLWLTLDVTPWKGAVFGAVLAGVAVLGDLTESMMKRDLDIKDMSQLLPGHGGLMDRLDSILFAVPTAYLLLSLIVPVG